MALPRAHPESSSAHPKSSPALPKREPQHYEPLYDDKTSTSGFLTRRQHPWKKCATGVHVIAAGGDGAKNVNKYGLIGSLSTNIMNAIPGSTNRTFPYDKTDTKHNPEAIPKGAARMLDWIHTYHEACPKTKMVVLGYSAGAMIAMNALCGATNPFPDTAGLDASWSDTVIGGIMYGDQTRVAGQNYDAGTCQAHNGKVPRGNPATCSNFALQSYCDRGDPECCYEYAGFQGDINNHFAYPGEYDQQAAKFIVERWNESQ